MQRSVGEEFTKRVSTLKNANVDDVSGRLASIQAWLEQEPITRAALAKLRTGVDGNKVFPETRQPLARPPAYTTEEIAFVGLTLMEHCRDQNVDFMNLCVAVGIDPGNVDLNVDQGLRDYIYPFLEFIAQEVDAAAAQTSTEGVLEMRMTDILTGELRELTPKTSAALSEVAKEFGSSSEGTKWQNVGNSCRHILKAFISELCVTGGVTTPDDVQAGNFKELSRRLVKEGDSRGTAAKLVEAVWDHAQTVTHRPLTTKDEALRVFVWTCLSISEIVRASSSEA
jgi:hypothetical protein